MKNKTKVIKFCRKVVRNYPTDYVDKCENNMNVAETGEGKFQGCPNNYGLEDIKINGVEFRGLCFEDPEFDKDKSNGWREHEARCQRCWKKALGEDNGTGK